jgi:hypothetical protein
LGWLGSGKARLDSRLQVAQRRLEWQRRKLVTLIDSFIVDYNQSGRSLFWTKTPCTKSGGTVTSREDPTWQHGAFTKALLDAFNDPAADINHNGMISPTVATRGRITH